MSSPVRYRFALLGAPLLISALPVPQELELIDAPRGRAVPVALYGATSGKPKPLALISHGYGGNNRTYSFIAEALSVILNLVQDPVLHLPGG